MKTIFSLLLFPYISAFSQAPFNVAKHSDKTKSEITYRLAFASFSPLNDDIYIANADGSNPRPILPGPSQDYNAVFSKDGKWIYFTSNRNGSADIYRVHSDGLGLEQLTNDPAFDDQASPSPDGKMIAFVSSRSGQADIYILNIATKKVTNITNHPAGDFRPAWSPDGKWIAFSSDRDSKKPRGSGGFETSHSTEIYMMHPDGTGLKRITNINGFAGSPSWSSDGKNLIFYEAETAEVNKIAGAAGLRGTTQIAIIDLKTNKWHVLTSGAGEKWSPRYVSANMIAYVGRGQEGGVEFVNGSHGERGEFNSPSWSNDGKQMVFHRDVEHSWPPFSKWNNRDTQFHLYRTGVFPSFSPDGRKLICNDKTAGILHNSILLMNSDGTNSRLLFTHPEKSALAPVWSPQGDKIAFAFGSFFQTIKGKAKADIAIINNDGSNLKILTDSTGNYGFPSWSPDGKSIVYRASSDSMKGLFIMDIETRKVRTLTMNSHDNFPAWSPTGDLIAFTSKKDGNYDIYTIKPDGTNLKRLTNTPGNNAHCSWSPDGKWLAFSTERGGFKDESALHPTNPQPYGEICVMRADGSDFEMLTDNQYEEATTAWFPLSE
jgi:Periplasmic component of the Tol biopolymer transport system